jgi:hypothetical protein
MAASKCPVIDVMRDMPATIETDDTIQARLAAFFTPNTHTLHLGQRRVYPPVGLPMTLALTTLTATGVNLRQCMPWSMRTVQTLHTLDVDQPLATRIVDVWAIDGWLPKLVHLRSLRFVGLPNADGLTQMKSLTTLRLIDLGKLSDTVLKVNSGQLHIGGMTFLDASNLPPSLTCLEVHGAHQGLTSLGKLPTSLRSLSIRGCRHLSLYGWSMTVALLEMITAGVERLELECSAITVLALCDYLLSLAKGIALHFATVRPRKQPPFRLCIHFPRLTSSTNEHATALVAHFDVIAKAICQFTNCTYNNTTLVPWIQMECR